MEFISFIFNLLVGARISNRLVEIHNSLQELRQRINDTELDEMMEKACTALLTAPSIYDIDSFYTLSDVIDNYRGIKADYRKLVVAVKSNRFDIALEYAEVIEWEADDLKHFGE